jgi:hypothetical protein
MFLKIFSNQKGSVEILQAGFILLALLLASLSALLWQYHLKRSQAQLELMLCARKKQLAIHKAHKDIALINKALLVGRASALILTLFGLPTSYLKWKKIKRLLIIKQNLIWARMNQEAYLGCSLKVLPLTLPFRGTPITLARDRRDVAIAHSGPGKILVNGPIQKFFLIWTGGRNAELKWSGQ